MKTALAILLVLVASYQVADAESKLTFEVSPEVAIPIGDFGDASGIGFGAVGGVDFEINPKLVLTGRVGHLHFLEKEETETFLGETITATSQYTATPILAGVKYYVAPSFYVGGEVGIHIFSATLEVSAFGVTESISEDSN